MSTAPHIPTNLPPDERVAIAAAAGYQYAADGVTLIPIAGAPIGASPPGDALPPPVEPSPTPIPGQPLEAAPAFDADAEREKAKAFFDLHSVDLAGASEAELGASAEASHGSPGEPLIVIPEGPPPCSLHDLAAGTLQLLAPLVSNVTSHVDAAGERVTGGILHIDDTTIALAVDAVAKVYKVAKSYTG